MVRLKILRLLAYWTMCDDLKENMYALWPSYSKSKVESFLLVVDF